MTLYGAARASFVRRLDQDIASGLPDDWEQRHDRIADWHIDAAGHRVCGCEFHQGWCPCCWMPDEVDGL